MTLLREGATLLPVTAADALIERSRPETGSGSNVLGRFRTLTPHLAIRNYLHWGEIGRLCLARSAFTIVVTTIAINIGCNVPAANAQHYPKIRARVAV